MGPDRPNEQKRIMRLVFAKLGDTRGASRRQYMLRCRIKSDTPTSKQLALTSNVISKFIVPSIVEVNVFSTPAIPPQATRMEPYDLKLMTLALTSSPEMQILGHRQGEPNRKQKRSWLKGLDAEMRQGLPQPGLVCESCRGAPVGGSPERQ